MPVTILLFRKVMALNVAINSEQVFPDIPRYSY